MSLKEYLHTLAVMKHTDIFFTEREVMGFCFLFFCTLSLVIWIFTITHKILQHYMDELCSHDNATSLLTSPLAENNGGAGALKVLWQFVKKHNKCTF